MKLFILTILVLSILGCAPEQNGTDNKNNTEITTQDIALALNMHKWLIKAPANCSPNDRLALQVISGGKAKTIYYTSAAPGEITKVIIWWNNDSPRAVHIKWMHKKSGSGGELKCDELQANSIGWCNEDKICTVGDTILSGVEGYKVNICLLTK